MNALYPSYKEQLLGQQANWLTDDIAVALYNADASFSTANTNIADIAGVQIAPGDLLDGKDITDGYAASFTTIYSALLSPEDVAVAIIYRVSDGDLIAFLDEVAGFTFQPSGANYTLTPGGPGNSYFAL